MICRNSCGCNPTADENLIQDINSRLPEMQPMDLLEEFKKIFLGHYEESFYSDRLFELLDPFLLHFIRPVFKRTSAPFSRF